MRTGARKRKMRSLERARRWRNIKLGYGPDYWMTRTGLWYKQDGVREKVFETHEWRAKR